MVDRTLDAFADFVARAGVKEELMRARLAAEGGNADRSLERERPTWPAQHHYRRVDEMLDKYDWRGISTSIMTQPNTPLRCSRHWTCWTQPTPRCG